MTGRPARRAPGLANVLALLALLAVAPPAARAGTEEFATFDVEQQEEDDEAILDRILTRPPRAWRDTFERAPFAFRTAQGCLTSGQWIIDSRLKLSTPMGERARFALDLRQEESDEVRYNYLDLWFRFPTRLGTFAAMFRPVFEKSAQDFAIAWETGSDTSALQTRAIFTFEDVFNNLWAFRQTRVGDVSEPYDVNPFEPGLYVAVRQPAWRATVEGRWLTISRKRLPAVDGEPERLLERWGALGDAQLEVRARGVTWELRGTNKQAWDALYPVGAPFGDDGDFRRKWAVESSLRGPVLDRLTLEGRWFYQDRRQAHEVPRGPGWFSGIDRVLGVEAEWAALSNVDVRLGALYDRASVAQRGVIFQPSHGSRTESRMYVGLTARFGRISVSGVEGIELDPEGYDVWAVHDKGFLHLQATF